MEELPGYDKDYVREEDIEAFEDALSEDDTLCVSLNSSASSVLLTDTTAGTSSSASNRIMSTNDWTPIYEKLDHGLRNRKKDHHRDGSNHSSSHKSHAASQRLRKANKPDIFSNSISYKLFRWPILIFALWWISCLFTFYLMVRMAVAFSEFILTWRGDKKGLREKLRNSQNYQEWVENAKKLDSTFGLDQWRKDPVFYYYDYRTLAKTIKNLRSSTNDCDIEQCMVVLQNCLKSNFAGIENPIMYSQTYYGTKYLIETYRKQVMESLRFISASDKVSVERKYRFFKTVYFLFGRSALCLSGGACFAYTHFGLIKALVENDLLPEIISGTSGGSLVAALACTRTNEELKKLLVPALAYKITACEDSLFTWFPRWWRTSARFDPVDWARKSQFFTMGSMTFQEVYDRTGKILNVSTVPSDPHSPVILCNHITSPDCVVWSALLASSSVPGILPPIILMTKDKHTADIVPFSFGSKWKDGSLRTDIPVEELNKYFNVTFSVVSQVNPHISFFFFAPKGAVGRPVSRRHATGLRGGFVGSAVENFLKLEIRKWLKFLKGLSLFPRLLDQDWSNVWLQRFTGTITVWPKMSISDFWYILSDPTPKRLEGMIRKGEMVAYPKLLFLKNRLDIERLISQGLHDAKLEYFQTVSSEIRESEDSEISGNLNSQSLTHSFGEGLEFSVMTGHDDDDGSEYLPEDLSDGEKISGSSDSDYSITTTSP
ncbi:hypothetical protein DASC09_015610 [Saccharomycopsis crataegensis]|uniref:Patatin-like phospholipase domain-containing protein n=1 Tax=Saccharomycopsis crataegensis TaxID=43959 RepID=A0AAV5QHS0_9ASCO|nr:hypothetical protein DASC09_015610 [Saccharomycopsis crataegensis]